ncbi:MAG: amidohydrolase [Chloroflexi bacterium]|nr:amidohydrolase [Chloroflexota bacterium]
MFATLALTNGRIHTLNPAQPFVTAVAIHRDKILALGDNEAMKALLGPGGKWVDLDGRAVTPGLVDAHVHFQWVALHLRRINLAGSPNLAAALQRIADHPTSNQQPTANDWLQGRGWNQDDWPDRAFPTAVDLDKAVPHRPTIFKHKSGHAAWVNSRALKIAGITAQTPDPPGGQIQRDGNGRPTGILFEDGINLVNNHVPPATTDEVVPAMRRAQELCWQLGLTGIHDFDGRICFRSLQILRKNSELGLRFVKNIPVYRMEHAIGIGLRSGFGDDWLRIGSVKIFADGALGPRTAAMLAPYENEPDNTGIIVADKEEMLEKASQASANGLSVAVHAIGDRANHDVLDVYEALRMQEGGWAGEPVGKGDSSHPLRHRLEHVQILHPSDLNRLAELNVIASMQPTHAVTDMEMATRYWGDRTPYSYAWRAMLNSGAVLAFGSDAPIEDIAPLPGLHAAVTRRRADGSPGPDGWHPEQKLTMQEAVHAFTLGAAYAAGQEMRQGSIAPGKLADFTIFPADIFAVSPDELLDMRVAGTIVGGQFKYRDW